MPVSSGLQKYFDSQKKKKWDMQKKLDSLAEQIHPAFQESFEKFHEKIMGIVEQDPQAESFIWEELESLESQLQESNRKHDLKKAASIIHHSE